jgi:integrase
VAITWEARLAQEKITKRSVDAAVVPARADSFLWDTDIRGFGLRVTPKGVKSYVLQFRVRNRPARRLTIGRHGSPWTVDSARDEARRLLFVVRQGVDPVEAQRRTAQLESSLEFADYARRFRDDYLKCEWKDSWSLAYRRLEQHVTPRFAGRSLTSIERFEITALLDSLRHQPALAISTFAVLRKLFRWAVGRGDLQSSPMTDMTAPTAQKARSRLLTNAELIAVWGASFELNSPFGSFVRLLIITLQRRNEVAGLKWSELSQSRRMWTLPAARAKNEKEHLVPLSNLALAEFDALGWARKGFVLTTTGRSAISGFSKAKAALDEAVRPILRSADVDFDEQNSSLERWTFHDIRRTGTTTMQALGVPIEVTEKVINHTSGETSGIRGVYNLHAYTDEKGRALQAWSDHLNTLIASVGRREVTPSADSFETC